ncbi:MAG: AAA family ATPase [Bacteroidia bacterium]|nr:AAA family ATPase [Bacteroidia bacterium]
MELPRRLFMAATGQHAGKTTCTLGLIAALRRHGINTGYCKPAGQRYLTLPTGKVDKDAPVFAEYFNFELIPALHSPVILASGVVTDYLADPDKYAFRDQILRAATSLEDMHELVVYEGTGHPGVGGVIGASNADVAAWLDASVILVVEAGIGKSLDQLTLNQALFRQKGVHIAGVIVNKAFPEKIHKIAPILSREMDRMGIPLLGILPYDAALSQPQVGFVSEALLGVIICHADQAGRRVSGLSPAVAEAAELDRVAGRLVVVSGTRCDDALASMVAAYQQAGTQTALPAGIVVCGTPRWRESVAAFIHHHSLPVIQTPFDTYETFVAYERLEVKHTPDNRQRMEQAIELFQQHIDLTRMRLPDSVQTV